MTLRVSDETIPGKLSPADSILLTQSASTARDLLRIRVQQEVECYNQSLPEVFQGLVRPEESMLLRADLPLTTDDAVRLVEKVSRPPMMFPYKVLLTSLHDVPMTPELSGALLRLRPMIAAYMVVRR